jgi:hypothetical protein
MVSQQLIRGTARTWPRWSADQDNRESTRMPGGFHPTNADAKAVGSANPACEWGTWPPRHTRRRNKGADRRTFSVSPGSARRNSGKWAVLVRYISSAMGDPDSWEKLSMEFQRWVKPRRSQ